MRVADRWFERSTLTEGVTVLTEPHLHPLIRCNIFHVSGRDRDLVVDTGAGVGSVRDGLEDLLRREVTAVATHIHYDHVGGLHEFADTVMHRIEAPRMADYRELAALMVADFGPGGAEWLASVGYPVEGEALIDALPAADFDVDAYAIESVTVSREVDEGDVLDLGDRAFEVLHLPGHSPGNLGLWEQTSGVLFTGDAIYDGPLLDGLEDSSIDDYVATMRRLRSLPVEVVHGGHGPSFGRARLIELADDYLQRRS